MTNVQRALLALDSLPFGATRHEIAGVVGDAIGEAFERGRVAGRLDVLLGETDQLGPVR